MQAANNTAVIQREDERGQRGAGIASFLVETREIFQRLMKKLRPAKEEPACDSGTFSTAPDRSGTHNRFAEALKRIRASAFYNSAADPAAPCGYFEGRRIITGTNRINGGVYLGVIAHEAVVVDEKYGSLKDLYNELILRFVREDGRRECIEEKIFKHVTRLTREKLPLDQEGVKTLAFKNRIKPDRKTALDFYIREKKGGVRHQVLLAAYFLEKLQSRGLIDGSIVIDHCFSELPAEDEKLVYTTPSGARFVFDPLAEQKRTALAA